MHRSRPVVNMEPTERLMAGLAEARRVHGVAARAFDDACRADQVAGRELMARRIGLDDFTAVRARFNAALATLERAQAELAEAERLVRTARRRAPGETADTADLPLFQTTLDL